MSAEIIDLNTERQRKPRRPYRLGTQAAGGLIDFEDYLEEQGSDRPALRILLTIFELAQEVGEQDLAIYILTNVDRCQHDTTALNGLRHAMEQLIERDFPALFDMYCDLALIRVDL